MGELIRKERGWAGHFICASECLFHRNTLLEFDGLKIVVSTVGSYVPPYNRDTMQRDMIGLNRYYETMAFIADNSKYNDADVCRAVEFKSNWKLSDPNMDIEADQMHEKVVEEISDLMRKGGVKIHKFGID